MNSGADRNSAFSLGAALAIVECERDRNRILYPESGDELLRLVREGSQRMREAGTILDALPVFPESGCNPEGAFLETRVDCYVAIFFLSEDKVQQEISQKLFIHLNDCFFCYDQFAEVLKDYHDFKMSIE